MRLASTCSKVEALDVSADAVARITRNAARNQLPQVTAREVNVFDELRRLEKDGARYETIVLDPPAFAKNKASVDKALAGYKEINLRALRLLDFMVAWPSRFGGNEVRSASRRRVSASRAFAASASLSLASRSARWLFR